MKSTYNILVSALVLLTSFSLFSCEKDDDTANISFVTTYPEFEMNGDRYVSVVQGGTFTDPGVIATEGGEEIEVTATGNVDVNTVGIYNIVYSATNSDGFAGSTTRTVAVIPAAEQDGVNIAGAYVRSGVTSNVTKLAPGLYLMPNVWGPNLIPSYIITTNGTDLLLPRAALSGYGPVSGTGTISDSGLMTLLVSLSNYGITDNRRVWQKQ